MRQRDTTRWGDFKNVTSLSELETVDLGTDALFTIEGDLPVDCMFKRGSKPTLHVCFNSALTPGADYVLPVFTWTKATEPLKGSRLFISDPTMLLSPEIMLGWYLGSRDHPVQELVEAVIVEVMARTGSTRVVFTGSSGGGFPALLYATKFDNSVACVNAPATTLVDHHNRSVVENFCAIANAGQPMETFPAILDITQNTGPGRGGKVIITQNLNDHAFIESHLQPFLKSRGLGWTGGSQATPQVDLIVDDWGEGHVMPPREVMRDTLSRIEDCPGGDFDFLWGTPEREPKCVIRKLSDGSFMAESSRCLPDCHYAFYLLKNGKKCETRSYKRSSSYIFRPRHGAGRYSLLLFERDENNQSTISRSPEIQIG